MDIKKNYKYCIVPECKNTTVTTPDKIFITLPKDNDVRTLWQKSMRRVGLLGRNSTKYCCEDHFNLQEDVENYMYFKMMKNVAIKLRPGVVPHIFNCQKRRKRLSSAIPATAKGHTGLDGPSGSTNLRLSDSEHSEFDSDNSENIQDSKVHKIFQEKLNHKSVQVNIKPTTRSKAIQCRILEATKGRKRVKLDSKDLKQISHSSISSSSKS